MKIKSILTIILTALIVLLFGIFLLFGNKQIYSESERRKLMEFPEFNIYEVFSGEYMSDFEKAATDNFPIRDTFRKIKAYTVTNCLMQSDNNGIFVCDGHISKLEYPLQAEMLDHAAQCFENIYKSYFENTDANLYFSIVPDKNMYLSENNNILTIDYQKLISYMKQKTDYMSYIDITNLLSQNDYYFTDSHWKQECITDVAEFIADKMNITLFNDYKINTVNDSFYGVYYGQSALNFKPDTIKYLTNDIIENCIVTIYPDGKAENVSVYDMQKAYDKDPYEMYLSGNQPIVEIENTDSTSGKKLVIFRDSFGSSLAPLLISGYSRITLIDTRYIHPSILEEFVNDADDVLFIYSTLILNSSLAIR